MHGLDLTLDEICKFRTNSTLPAHNLTISSTGSKESNHPNVQYSVSSLHQSYMKVSTAKVLECVIADFGLNSNTIKTIFLLRFITHFGCKPSLAAQIWNKINKDIDYQINFNNLK